MSIVIKAPAASGTEYTLPSPVWGYKTDIKMSLVITRTKDGGVMIFDRGSDYDYRTLECSFFLNVDDANILVNICKDAGKGRDNEVDIILSAGCGFYPYGPDKGDSGTFKSRILNVTAESSIGHPQDMFVIKLNFLFTGSYPYYSIPAKKSEGNLTIGSVSGIRYPQNMHVQNNRYNIVHSLTENGTPYVMDKTTGDIYESTLDIVSNHQNMSNLVNELSVTVRKKAVNIIPPSNSYLFGRENASTATYSCKLLQNTITVSHTNYNEFSTILNFYRVAE